MSLTPAPSSTPTGPQPVSDPSERRLSVWATVWISIATSVASVVAGAFAQGLLNLAFFDPDRPKKAPELTVDATGEPVSRCTTIAGSGKRTDEWDIWVAVSGSAQGSPYSMVRAQWSSDTRWFARVTVGGVGNDGVKFRVSAFAVPLTWSDYFQNTHAYGDQAWVGTTSLPPNRERLDTINVVRNDDDTPCS